MPAARTPEGVPTSLLERVAALIERTYARDGLERPERFVIGDAGLRRLYGLDPSEQRPMVLIRSTQGVQHVRVYYPDGLIANLERNDPSRGLSERNLDDFAIFVEELDHLLVIVARVRDDRPVTAVELELHANVTKMLVVSLFLARTLGTKRLDARQRAALRWELFERGDYGSEEPALRGRYLDARRHALRFLDRLESVPPTGRAALLREFSRASVEGKLALCQKGVGTH